MLRRRRGAVSLHSRQPQQLQSGRAHAPCGAGDQRGLAGPHFRDAMNHLPRGHVVQDHRGRIAIGDAVGDRKEVFGLAYEKFREAAVHGKRRHTLAHFETGDTSADRFDHAGDLITRHERYLRRVPDSFRPT